MEKNRTFQVPDEGNGLDGVAGVSKGLDDVVLHHTDHAETRLMTWNTHETVKVTKKAAAHSFLLSSSL